MKQEMQVREPEVIGEMRVPRADVQPARAELKKMLQRGEVGTVFNPRFVNALGEPDPKGGEWVVEYVRLREPRSKVPWYAALVSAAMGAVVGVGVLLWASRWVLLAGLATVAVVALLAMLFGSRSSGGSCSGVHVKH